MSKPKGVATPFMLLLVFSSVVSPKLIVFGSSPADQSEQQRFKRSDPLQHFEDYNGGYNIRDEHYWASAAFTGVHGYVIAGAWILCGVCFSIFVIAKKLKSGTFPATDRFWDRYYVMMFLVVLFLTTLALVATSFVLVENQISLRRTKNLKNTILKAGENARKTIKKVKVGLTVIDHQLTPYEQQSIGELEETNQKLGIESQVLDKFVKETGHSIDTAIRTSYTSHIVVVTINMILVVTALVLLLLHWHPGFITIIIMCWVLTALCWVLTGLDFFLNTFAEDTCAAFEDFVKNPQNNSLSSLLPCMDSEKSHGILSKIGFTIRKFVEQVNMKIKESYSAIGIDEDTANLLGLGMVCDPFSGGPNYTYAPNNCSMNSIRIRDLPHVLEKFACKNGDTIAACAINGKFIPHDAYMRAMAYSKSAQDMLNIYPDLVSLTQCTIVKNTFLKIIKGKQCKSFMASVRFLWISMLCLSVFMVTLVLFWVVKACQDAGKSFSRCSIIPNTN